MSDPGWVTTVLADVGNMHDGLGGGWWVVLGMVLFWAAVIAIVSFARGASGKQTTSDHRPAREVLDQRLAEGEISVEEYERRRALLDGDASAPSAGAGSS